MKPIEILVLEALNEGLKVRMEGFKWCMNNAGEVGVEIFGKMIFTEITLNKFISMCRTYLSSADCADLSTKLCMAEEKDMNKNSTPTDDQINTTNGPGEYIADLHRQIGILYMRIEKTDRQYDQAYAQWYSRVRELELIIEEGKAENKRLLDRIQKASRSY